MKNQVKVRITRPTMVAGHGSLMVGREIALEPEAAALLLRLGKAVPAPVGEGKTLTRKPRTRRATSKKNGS